MPLAISLSRNVLPAFGGETMSPRCPRPIGRDQVDQPAREVGARRLEVDHLVREDRGQVLEVRALLRGLRVEAVDVLDAEEPVVLLAVLRRAHLAAHVVASAQAEAPDLRLAYVDVVAAGQQ